MRDYVRGKGWVGAKDGKPVDPTTGQPREDAALLRRVRKFKAKFSPGILMTDIEMVQFAEQIVRECADAASAHKRKDYDHRCSLEFRYGYECAAKNAEDDILRKFGLKE